MLAMSMMSMMMTIEEVREHIVLLKMTRECSERQKAWEPRMVAFRNKLGPNESVFTPFLADPVLEKERQWFLKEQTAICHLIMEINNYE